MLQSKRQKVYPEGTAHNDFKAGAKVEELEGMEAEKVLVDHFGFPHRVRNEKVVKQTAPAPSAWSIA